MHINTSNLPIIIAWPSWFLLNVYHCCAVVNLKNPKLAVGSQGLSVVYWAFSTWLQTGKELFEWVSRFSLLSKFYQPAWCTWNLLIVNSTRALCRSHVPFCWLGQINDVSFYQRLLQPSVSFAFYTNVLKLHLYSYLLRSRFRNNPGLKGWGFWYLQMAEKGVIFVVFVIALESWEKESASDLCMRSGNGDNSAIPKCLSEIWSRTCTEYNVLLFQETGRRTAVLLSCLLGG